MKANAPILTVVLLTYQHENTIAACLDSVLSQKTKYQYLILIAEDCSTDNTLKICKEYAAKYPQRIQIITQPKNTKANHLREVLYGVNTKYWALLEGDDRWCDQSKIETAIGVLEKNPRYVTFAHDTLYNDISSRKKQSLVHDILKVNIKNPVLFETAPYLHTSSRVHRNVVNFRNYFKHVKKVRDIHLFYAYLDKGPLYYLDKTMSVYNITGVGAWSELTTRGQLIGMEESYHACNRLLGFRHDDFFSSRARNPRLLNALKRGTGVRLGWSMYVFIIKILIRHSKET